MEGLRLVDANVLCVPHYAATQSNGRPRSEDSDAMLVRECDANSFVSVGIDEEAAIVVEDGYVRAVSAKGDAHLHVLRTDGNGVIQHKHVREENGRQRWEEFISFNGAECEARSVS